MIKRYVAALAPAAGGTPNTFFAAFSNESGSASFEQQQANLTGVATAVLTIQITSYANTNPAGLLKVNGGIMILGDQFTVTLDGSGHGHFIALVQGNAGAGGTIIEVTFTIVGMTLGNPSSPITYQIGKEF